MRTLLNIASACVVSAAIVTCLTISAGAFSFSAAIATTSALIISVLLGDLSIRCLRLPFSTAVYFPASLLIGFGGVSLFMMCCCLILRWTAVLAFIVTAALVLIGYAILSRRARRESESKIYPLPTLVTCFGLCVLTSVWSWQATIAPLEIPRTGRFFAWIDFYFHALSIAQFAYLQGQNIFDLNSTPPLYHYASYLVSAWTLGISHLPEMAVAASWNLLGFTLMACGAWVLGGTLAGWFGGWASLVGVLLIPNAAHYLLSNPFFDLIWILQISPGLSYGLAFSLLILSILVLCSRERSFGFLVVAIVFTLAAAPFKMHFVFVLLPLCCLALVCFLPIGTPFRRMGVLAAIITIGLIALIAAERVQRAPHFFSGSHDLLKLETLLLGMVPSQSAPLFEHMKNDLPRALSTVLGVPLIDLAATGLLIPALAGLVIVKRRVKLVERAEILPWLVLLVYSGVVALFPVGGFTGSIEEYQHRTFVLIYATFAVFVFAAITQLLDTFLRRPIVRIAVVSVIVCFLPVPFVLQRSAQSGVMPWTKAFASLAIPRDLLTAALFIRSHSSDPSEAVVKSSLGNDTMFLALSGHAGVLGALDGVAYSEDYLRRRSDLVKQLLVSPDLPTLSRNAHSAHVRWFLIDSPNVVFPSRLNEAIRLRVNDLKLMQCW